MRCVCLRKAILLCHMYYPITTPLAPLLLARYLDPVRNLRNLDKSARKINKTKTKDYYLYNDSYSLFSFLCSSLEYEEGNRCEHVPKVGKWYQRSKQQAMFIQPLHAIPPLMLLASLVSPLLNQMPLRRPQSPLSLSLSLQVR